MAAATFSYRWILNEDQPDSSRSQKRRKLITKFFFLLSFHLFIYRLCHSRRHNWHSGGTKIIIIIYNPYHLFGKLSVFTTTIATQPPSQKLLFNFCFWFGRVCERVRSLFNDHLMACRVPRQDGTRQLGEKRKYFIYRVILWRRAKTATAAAD